MEFLYIVIKLNNGYGSCAHTQQNLLPTQISGRAIETAPPEFIDGTVIIFLRLDGTIATALTYSHRLSVVDIGHGYNAECGI